MFCNQQGANLEMTFEDFVVVYNRDIGPKRTFISIGLQEEGTNQEVIVINQKLANSMGSLNKV